MPGSSSALRERLTDISAQKEKLKSESSKYHSAIDSIEKQLERVEFKRSQWQPYIDYAVYFCLGILMFVSLPLMLTGESGFAAQLAVFGGVALFALGLRLLCEIAFYFLVVRQQEKPQEGGLFDRFGFTIAKPRYQLERFLDISMLLLCVVSGLLIGIGALLNAVEVLSGFGLEQALQLSGLLLVLPIIAKTFSAFYIYMKYKTDPIHTSDCVLVDENERVDVANMSITGPHKWMFDKRKIILKNIKEIATLDNEEQGILKTLASLPNGNSHSDPNASVIKKSTIQYSEQTDKSSDKLENLDDKENAILSAANQDLQISKDAVDSRLGYT